MEEPIFPVKPPLIRALSRDLDKLLVDGHPSEEELAGAPILERWGIGAPAAYGLSGYGWGHPLLGDGPIRTSAVYALARDFTWVRTLSRYYRLKDRAEP